VISNLVGNAVKFTPAGGHIFVSATRDGGHATLCVRDDGPGIPPQALGRIFNLFEQGEQDIARSRGGLGLGLSIVQQLVSMHGGDVSAFSKGIPGEGSEFIVRLPAVAAPLQRAKSQTRAVATEAASALVLIVDDNRDAAETMALLVEALGYGASVVNDGPAAVDAVKREAPALVLLDIGLPGLSGLEVAQRIRSEMADPPPLIAVTGYGQERDRQLSFDAGFFAHLTKPLDIEQLEILLRRLLDPR
jgi:CheY-like chemotaxis protein